MKQPEDVVRLLDSRSSAGWELRQALRELQAERREFGERGAVALAMRLRPALGLHTPTSAQLGFGWVRSGWRLLRACALGTALVVGASHHDSVAHEPAAQSHPSVCMAALPEAEAKAVAASGGIAPPPEPASPADDHTPPPPPPAPRPSDPRTSRPEGAAARTQGAQPELELTLLREAQSSLEHEPARSLRLAERHRREHPHGMFAQEREVLAVAALLRLDRGELAAARAKRFVGAYPGSPHARAVGLMLAGVEPDPSLSPLPHSRLQDRPGTSSR